MWVCQAFLNKLYFIATPPLIEVSLYMALTLTEFVSFKSESFFKDMLAMKADKNQNEEQLPDKETEEIFSEHEDFTEVIIEDDTDEGMEFKY